MDRKTLMAEVAKTALERRIELYALFRAARVSSSVAHRYIRQGIAPTLPTIGKLEEALERAEKEKAT
jgi:hypothetical protein